MKNEILEFANFCKAAELKRLFAVNGLPGLEINYNDKGAGFSGKGLRLKNILKAQIQDSPAIDGLDVKAVQDELRKVFTEYYAKHNVIMYYLSIVECGIYSVEAGEHMPGLRVELDIRYNIDF